MKIKRLLAVLMALTVACSVFAGCGDDDDDSSSKKSKKNSSEVSAVDDDSEGSKDDEKDSKDDEASKDESKDESSEDESKDESSEDESSEDESSIFGGDDSSKAEIKTEPAIDVNDVSEIAGKWECEYMEFDGVKMEDFMGIPVAAMMQLEFKSGGKGTVREMKGDSDETQEFTWEEKDGKIVVSANGGDLEFELKDGRLVAEMTEGGQTEKVALKKVNKFTEFDFDAFKDSMNEVFDMSGLDLDALESMEF